MHAEPDAFCAHASSLLVAPDGDEEIGRRLLWHAARELPALRCGGALLATPESPSSADTLTSLGFAPTSAAADDDVLALVTRRDPDETVSYSHTALRVSASPKWKLELSLTHKAHNIVFLQNGAMGSGGTELGQFSRIEMRPHARQFFDGFNQGRDSERTIPCAAASAKRETNPAPTHPAHSSSPACPAAAQGH